jgi:hypothetical protein
MALFGSVKKRRTGDRSLFGVPMQGCDGEGRPHDGLDLTPTAESVPKN